MGFLTQDASPIFLPGPDMDVLENDENQMSNDEGMQVPPSSFVI